MSSIKSFEEWEVKCHKRDLKEKKGTFEKEIAQIKKKKLVKEGKKALQSLSFRKRFLWRGKMQEDCNAMVGFPHSVTLACRLVQEGT